MGLPLDVLRANADFIERLDITDARALSVSNEGRIGYREGFITRLFTRIIGTRVDPASILRRSVEVLINERSPTEHDVFRAYLSGVISKLEAHGALPFALKQQILSDHQRRIVSGYRAHLDAISAETEVARGGAGASPVVMEGAYEERASRLARRAKIATEMADDPLLPEEYRANFGIFATAREAGASESFFVKGLDGTVGVFKPRDGEVGMADNTRGLWRERPDEGYSDFIKGVKIGTMYQREVAASRFCYGKLGTVPVTCPFTVRGTLSPGGTTRDLVGSLQEFVKDSDSYEDYVYKFGVSFLVRASIPTTHGIVLRDLLIGSCDRHFGNVLFKEGILYGIDNGASFPEGLLYHRHPVSGTISHIALREGCQRPLCAEVKEEFASIDLETEISSLKRDGLITNRQEVELRMRYILLQKLIAIEPSINVFQIASCFLNDSCKESPVVQIAQKTWNRLSDEMRGADMDHLAHEMYDRFLAAFTEEIDRHFTDGFLAKLRTEHPG